VLVLERLRFGFVRWFQQDVPLTVLLLLLVACGRINFDPTNESACSRPSITLPAPPTTMFGAPIALSTLNSIDSDDDPTLTDDQLEIIFQSGRGGQNRLWHSIRASTIDPWPAPTPITELDGIATNTPELSRDGLRLRFALPGIAGPEDLYEVSRPDRASPWGNLKPLEGLETDAAETGAAEFLDGHGLVFYSSRPGGTAAEDLWEAYDDSCTGFFDPTPLAGGVATGVPKGNPWMRNDGLVVAYNSDGTLGNGDFFIASRSVVGGPFDTPVELVSVSSTNVDDDPWLDDAMQSIYFASARAGSQDLYYASR